MRTHRSRHKKATPAPQEVIPTFVVGPDSHDVKWAQFTSEDAAFVRSALGKYNEILQQSGQIAARYYLEGMADLKDAQARTDVGRQLMRDVDMDQELTQFFQKPIDTEAQPS